MVAIPVEFTEKEYAAIAEYAGMCEESVSSIVKKIIIQEITFMKGKFVNDPAQYEYHMFIPYDVSDEDELKIIESNYNKIRRILDWDEINLR